MNPLSQLLTFLSSTNRRSFTSLRSDLDDGRHSTSITGRHSLVTCVFESLRHRTNLSRAFGIFLISFFSLHVSHAQTTYTWTGTTDTLWTTSTNWSPNGVPDSASTVVISDQSNDPALTGNVYIRKLTLNSGTFDLNDNTLEVEQSLWVYGGTITEGLLYARQAQQYSDVLVIQDAILNCKVDIRTPIATLESCVYNDSVRIDQYGGWTQSAGDNIFNDHLHYVQSGGPIRFGNTVGPDSIRSTMLAEIESTASNKWWYCGTQGVYFGDDVTIRNHSDQSLEITGHAYFDGDIIVGAKQGYTGRIELGENNYGVTISDGHCIKIDAMGYGGGTLQLYDLTQEGAATNDLSTMSGTLEMTDVNIGGDIITPDSVSVKLYGSSTYAGVELDKVTVWQGATFNGKVNMTTTSVATGGNVFKDTVHLTCSTGQIMLGYSDADTALAPFTLVHNGTMEAYLNFRKAGSYFGDDLTITNNNSGDKWLFLGYSSGATTTYDGDITLNQTDGKGLRFLGTSNTVNGGIRTGSAGFTTGKLYFSTIDQTSNDSIVLNSIPATSDVWFTTNCDLTGHMNLDGGKPYMYQATFNGGASVTAGSIPPTYCHFGGDTYFTKTGTTNNLTKGNYYGGDLTVTNESNTNYLYLGYSAVDTVLGDVTLINNGSALLWFASNTKTPIYGDLDVDGTGEIRFGHPGAGDYLAFEGSGNQNITIGDSITHRAYRMLVDKPSGHVILKDSLVIDDELKVNQGRVICQEDGMITIWDAGVFAGVSDSTYVEGPVKKVGNDAFDFPVGRNGLYRPVSITAPATTTDEFVAEYYESNSDNGYDHSNKDSTLNHLSTNEYWTLERTNGTSTPVVTLSWDSIASCDMDTPLTGISVAGWSVSSGKWKDLGNGGITGNVNEGTIETASGVTEFSAFTFATDSTMGCADCNNHIMLVSSDTTITLTLLPNETFKYGYSKTYGEFVELSFNTLYEGDSIYPQLTVVRAPCSRGDTICSLNRGSLFLTKDDSGNNYEIQITGPQLDTVECVLRIQTYPTGNCQKLLNTSFEQVGNSINICNDINVAPNWHTNLANGADWYHEDVPISGTVGSSSSLCALLGTVSPNNVNGEGHGGLGISPSGVEEFLWQPIPNIGPLSAYYKVSYYVRKTQGTDPMDLGFAIHGFIDETFTDQEIANTITTVNNNGVTSPAASNEFTNTMSSYQHIQHCTFVPGALVGNMPIFYMGLFGDQTASSNYFFIDDVTVTETICINGNIQNYCHGETPANPIISTDGGTNISWSIGGSQVGTGTSFDYSGYPVGSHTIEINGVTPNGCTVTEIRDFEVFPSPEATITGDDHYCASTGEPAVLTVSPFNSNYTYQWSDSGSPAGNTESINVDGGTYDVTVTSDNGCVTTSAPHVVNHSDVQLEVIGYDHCPTVGTLAVTSVSGGAGPYTYSWSPSINLINSDQSVAYINSAAPPANGTHTFTVTVTDATGCTGTADVTIDVNYCCFGETVGSTNYTTLHDNSSNWPGTLTGIEFAINGTFTVSNDMTFDGCDIVMGPGAEIVIEDGETLTLDDCHVYPCESPWLKIQVNDGGELNIPNGTTGTTIEQGVVAVWIKGGDGYASIEGATFDRNLTSIFVEDFASGENPALIAGNTFKSTGTVPIFGTNESYAGIVSDNVHELEVGNGTDANVFQDCWFGIKSTESGLDVDKNTFQDIVMDDGQAPGFHGSGFGIYADGNEKLTLNVNDDNVFNDVSFGVVGLNFKDANIVNNEFEDIALPSGIGTVDNRGEAIQLIGCESVLVKNNGIEDCEIGVHVEQGQNMNTEFCEIQNNQIGQSGGNTYDNAMGIWVVGGKRVLIHNHRANATGGEDGYIDDMRFGITTMNVPGVHINHNELSVNDDNADLTYGMYSYQCNGAIRDNEIAYSNSFAITPDYGIITWQNNGMAIRCNELKYPTVGLLRFDETGGPYSIVSNDFYGDQLVSIFDYYSIFPEQGSPTSPADNRWIAADDFSFHSYANSAAGQAGRIYVRPLPTQPDAQDYEYNPANNWNGVAQSPNLQDYEILLDVANQGTTSGDACSDGFQIWDELVHGIALDTLSYEGDTTRNRKMAMYSLYRAALLDSTLGADSIVGAFVDSLALTTLGELDSISMALGWNLDSAYADSLLNINDKITTNDSIESLWKEVNDLALEHVLRNDSSLTQADWDALEDIAELCALDHGPAVMKARALLASIDGNPRLFLNSCEQISLPSPPSQRLSGGDDENGATAEEVPATEMNVSVYPNPNHGEITIMLSDPEFEEGHSLRVIDLLGKEVYRAMIPQGRHRLQLPMSDGTYLYEIDRTDGSTIDNGQLIILNE